MKKIKSKFPLTIYLLVCLASITRNKSIERNLPPRSNNEDIFEFGDWVESCTNNTL